MPIVIITIQMYLYNHVTLHLTNDLRLIQTIDYIISTLKWLGNRFFTLEER